MSLILGGLSYDPHCTTYIEQSAPYVFCQKIANMDVRASIMYVCDMSRYVCMYIHIKYIPAYTPTVTQPRQHPDALLPADCLGGDPSRKHARASL